MASGSRYKKFASGITVLIVIVASVNIIMSQINGRVDLTEGSVYSLTEGSKNITAKFNKPVDIKFFFSRTHKELPVIIKTYATRVEELLREYASHANTDFNIEVIDPKPDTDNEEWARKFGVSPVRLPQGNEMFFGAVFLQNNKEVVIPYFDPRREEFLEYDVSESLLKLLDTEKPKLGVISSIEMFGNPMARQPGWAVISELQKRYEVQNVGTDVAKIDDSVSMLLVLHPKNLSEKTQFAIDQFVMKGGKLFIAVDSFSRTDLASSQNPMMGMQQQRPDPSSNLDKLMNAWGLTFDKANLVGDMNYATNINAGGEQVNYPYFLSLRSAAFSRELVVTQGLDDMLFAEGGSFEFKKDPKQGEASFEPLLSLTNESGVGMAQMAQFMPPSNLASQFKSDNKERVLAGVLKGKFNSAFSDIPQDLKDAEGDAKVTSMFKTAEKETHILVIGDIDFIADHNAVDAFRFAGQTIIRPKNDNLNFVLNAVEFLSGNNDLISIRSRGKISRPFDRVLQIQKEAQQKWKGVEEDLSKQISEVQKKINELQKQRTDGNVFKLSPEQQAEIAKFRNQEVEARRKRRQVRKSLREDIESLGHVLTAANLLFVPILVSLFGSVVFYRRSRRTNLEVNDNE